MKSGLGKITLLLLMIFLSGCGPSAGSSPTTAPTLSLPSVTQTPPPATAPPVVAGENTQSPVEGATQAVIGPALPTNVAVIPDPADYAWEVIAEGFSRPTGLSVPYDGSGRLFVLEQEGLIHVIQDGVRLPVPFLDLRGVASTRGSTVRGLLGMVFHPKYAENGYFYVHYTQEGGDSVIARVAKGDG